MRHALTITLMLWTVPLLAQSNAPISAIDWLSQPSLATLSEKTLIVEDPTTGAVVEDITVIELDAPVTKSYGLIPAKISGIPQDFWTDLDPDTLTQIIGSLSELGLPAAEDLLLRALLAESLGDDAVLGIRVWTLLDRGAVHAAYSLLGQSEINNLESFALFAEAALLTDNVEHMCSQLNAARHLSNNEALQVYCHARAGSWDTAVLNYFTLNTLGAFSPTTSALLAADLDPELADVLSLPMPDPISLTALEFKLRASVGQPVSTQTLPLKFIPSYLSASAGWKQQIEAAERLGAVGSLPAAQLLERYKSSQPSASGGVWDRVLAVQNLDRALTDPIIDPSDELLALWTLMRDRKLAAPLARAWANKLIKFGEVPEKDDILFQMQVLASANTMDFSATMARLHSYNPQVLTNSYQTLMAQFDGDIFASIPFRSANMLRAMRLISDALDGNDAAFFEAISLYRAMGLTPLAQQLSMEFMILATDR